jgi:hypothetical protein
MARFLLQALNGRRSASSVPDIVTGAYILGNICPAEGRPGQKVNFHVNFLPGKVRQKCRTLQSLFSRS